MTNSTELNGSHNVRYAYYLHTFDVYNGTGKNGNIKAIYKLSLIGSFKLVPSSSA